MDQNQTPEHLPDRHGVLLTVSDARVGHSLRVQPEKIVVLCDHDAPAGSGELKVRPIGSANQPGAYGSSHVDVAMPKTSGDIGWDVLVEVKPNGAAQEASKPSSRSFANSRDG